VAQQLKNQMAPGRPMASAGDAQGVRKNKVDGPTRGMGMGNRAPRGRLRGGRRAAGAAAWPWASLAVVGLSSCDAWSSSPGSQVLGPICFFFFFRKNPEEDGRKV